MGSGYTYEYRFWMDTSMIQRYLSNELKPNTKFVFETRTKFVVHRTDKGGAAEIVDTETFETGAGVDVTAEALLSRRLEEYGMTNERRHDLVNKALAFAREKEANSENASLPFIPIAIHLHVYTVQLPGEPIDDTFRRAIRPQHMGPIQSCLMPNNFVFQINCNKDIFS